MYLNFPVFPTTMFYYTIMNVKLNMTTTTTQQQHERVKYPKVARKLAMVEADLERAEERAEQGEKYVYYTNE